MTAQFRVLVIDDKVDVLKRLPQRVSLEPRSFEGRTWQIDLRPVAVKLDKLQDGSYQISRGTLEDLSSACAQPPDIILSSYGFVEKDVSRWLADASKDGREITQEDLAGKLLTIPDLARAIRAFVQDLTVDSYKRRNLGKNFLEIKRKVYLYTYTSGILIRHLGEVSARANLTRKAFPNFEVDPVNTKDEFYGGTEFDWPNASKYDVQFHSYLVSGLIEHIVQRELLERILLDAKRLKYVRVRRSVLSVGSIVAIGGAIGAGAEWLGSRIVGLATAGNVGLALVIVASVAVIVLLFGVFFPVVFERLMSGLLMGAETEDN